MFWKNNKKLKDWVKKVDKLVTTVIIWSAIASIFWLSQTKKWKEISQNIHTKVSPKVKSWWGWVVSFFTHIIKKISWLFSKQK